MNSLADSDAFFDPERMLAQHQAALTLLQGKLANTATKSVRWLDLASGRGQIIVHLDKNLTETQRAKLIFQGYDVDNAHSRVAAKTADSMHLQSAAFEIGELASFARSPITAGPWDFITLTNTIHEINPRALAGIFAECIGRLTDTGCLFLYDMEVLPSSELGAVLWTGAEMKAMLTTLVGELGCRSYEPAVGTWKHRTCDGWNAQLQRDHMDLPQDFQERIRSAVAATATRICELLESKLEQVKKALEGLTRFGPETGEETDVKERYLFDFWAITRALEVAK